MSEGEKSESLRRSRPAIGESLRSSASGSGEKKEDESFVQGCFMSQAPPFALSFGRPNTSLQRSHVLQKVSRRWPKFTDESARHLSRVRLSLLTTKSKDFGFDVIFILSQELCPSWPVPVRSPWSTRSPTEASYIGGRAHTSPARAVTFDNPGSPGHHLDVRRHLASSGGVPAASEGWP
ncbi:Hypothetical predicted protein [Cloeon dipterum]|uniref:Uncharacterized protein n=1 Tax=Cloeon dipterum TaxID=197152 RepID=A0A8S1E4M4_9INSE|nr:Hypothetical predicted protein [Cloeon dipterum]